jgi:hypothetical protein
MVDLKKVFKVDDVERRLDGLSDTDLAFYRHLPEEFRQRYGFAVSSTPEIEANITKNIWSERVFNLCDFAGSETWPVVTLTTGQMTDLALYGLYQFIKHEGDKMDTPKKEEDKSKIINPNAPVPKEKQDEGEIQYPLPNDPKDGFPGA